MKAKRERELSEVAAMTRRMIRACGKRAGEGDPVDLAELVRLREAVDEALVEAVRRQHEGVPGYRGGGYSWAQIAAGLGSSRQAVQQRFQRAAERRASA